MNTEPTPFLFFLLWLLWREQNTQTKVKKMVNVETFCNSLTSQLQDAVEKKWKYADCKVEFWYKKLKVIQVNIILYNFNFTTEDLEQLEKEILKIIPILYHHKYSVTGTHRGIRYYNKFANPYYED